MPRPIWLSPDSAAVTDRSLRPLSWRGRGNAPFYQLHFVGPGEVGAIGMTAAVTGAPVQAEGGFPLGARVGVRGCGHAGHLHGQEGS